MGFGCGKMLTSKVHAGNGSSRRPSFSLDAYEKSNFFFAFENQTRSCEACCGRSKSQKQLHKGSSASSSSSSPSSSSSSYRFVIKRARCSVARLYQRIRSGMSRVQHSIPRHRSRSQPTAPSTRVPSAVSMTPQSRYARFGDSHQTEAIEDCIKFLKNSSRKEEFLDSSSCQLQHLLHSHRC